jgi:hypothetical protein
MRRGSNLEETTDTPLGPAFQTPSGRKIFGSDDQFSVTSQRSYDQMGGFHSAILI